MRDLKFFDGAILSPQALMLFRIADAMCCREYLIRGRRPQRLPSGECLIDVQVGRLNAARPPRHKMC